MADFLRIDEDLMAAAAEGASDTVLDGRALHAWIKALPARDKDKWLLTAVDDPQMAIGTDLVAAYRSQLQTTQNKRRTVAGLLARAEELRTEREEAEARQAIAAQRKAKEARRKHLAKVARQGEKAWQRLDKLVDGRKYDEAVQLTLDLHDVAFDSGRSAMFDDRILALRKQHARRRGYLDSVKRALAQRSQERDEV